MPAMVKLMVYFLLGPAEAGEEERPADFLPSSDKEGELWRFMDFSISCGSEPEPVSFLSDFGFGTS